MSLPRSQFLEFMMLKIAQAFKRQLKRFSARQRGQGLVELVIVTPILIFIFIGLLEVGWALRSYMILLSTNRETARFAARGDKLLDTRSVTKQKLRLTPSKICSPITDWNQSFI